jgi:hypothetical protein
MKEYKTVTPVIVHPSTPNQVSQEQTPTKILMELPPPLKFIKLKAIKGSPFIQKKKEAAEPKKTDFKKMVCYWNSSHSDTNNKNDCCKECKEYFYVTKQDKSG